MAVAVKNNPETGIANLLDRLSVASLVGVVYVLGCLAIVFKALPTLWWQILGFSGESFFAVAGLTVLMLAATAGLIWLGGRLVGGHPLPGLRAGIFTGSVLLLLAAMISRWFAGWLEGKVLSESSWFTDNPTLAILLSLLFTLLVLGGVGRLFLSPGMERFLVRFESQGWFTATAFKPGQGQRVRRGTILGILILAGCGIWVMVEKKTLYKGAADWSLEIPFTGKVTVSDPGDAKYLAASLPDGAEKTALDNMLKEIGENQRPVVDQYLIHDLNQKRLNSKAFRRIEDPGFFAPIANMDAFKDKFKENMIVDASESGDSTYARAVEALKKQEREKDPAAFDASKQGQELERLAGVAAPRTKEIQGSVQFASFTLLPSVKFTVPLLFAAIALWFAWRVVNLPVFADFLIATEAELNKVSWTTRARLYQDTVVVLSAVILLTLFLLLVDVTWSKLLSWEPIGVLKVPTESTKDTKGTELKW